MIVFIEGPDGCGKSNIAKALADKYNLIVYKNSAEFELFEKNNTDRFVDLFRYAAPIEYNFAKLYGGNIIFDRNYISEYVYSKVFNRDTDLKLIKHLDYLYSCLDSFVIHCYKSKYKSYFDDFININDLAAINSKYIEYFDKYNTLPLYSLDTTDENLNEQINLISNFIDNRKR